MARAIPTTSAWPATEGAVKPTFAAPSLLIAAPRITAWMVSPSACASSRRFRTTIPTPLPGTVPRAAASKGRQWPSGRSEEHTSELQSLRHLVCRLLLEKKNAEAHGREYLGKNILWSGFDFDLLAHNGAGTYECGEESALFFFFNGTPAYEINTLSLHDALPI